MFHENLKRLRKEKNWSQKDLAQELLVSQQAVAKWETQQAVPRLDVFLKLMDIFEVSAGQLLGSRETASQNVLQMLSDAYKLDTLDNRLIHFYLELEPDTRTHLKKHLLFLLDYLDQGDSPYEKYRAAYIRKNALPYAAYHGNVEGLKNVPEEYDAAASDRKTNTEES